MKRWLALVPAVAFLGVLAAFALGLQRDPSRLPSMLVGKPLPSFVLPPVRDGDTGLASADLAGQPVMINFFASWCVACREEHPMLLQLRAQGASLVGVDWKDKAADGARYLIQNGDPYGRAGNDRTGRMGIDMGVSGVPETFIVDRRGKVRYRHVGAITPQDWTEKIGPLMARLKAES